MAKSTNVQATYESIGIKEDLADVIYNVDPFDTPFMSAVGRGSVTQPTWDWQVDELDAPQANAVEEGEDKAVRAVGATQRIGNHQMISDKVIGISGSNEATMKAGRGSEMAYQLAKKSKELKTDMEYNLIGQKAIKVVRADGTAPITASVPAWLKTNVTGGTSFAAPAYTAGVHPDGTLLPTEGTPITAADADKSETRITDMLEGIYNVSGKSPDLLLVSPKMKTFISANWKGRATEIKQGADNKTAYHVVDFYVSDFGSLRMVPSRIIAANFTNDAAFAIETSCWSIDYLRSFQTVDLAKTGDTERKYLLAEYGLRCNNEKSSGALYDIAK
jgi:hypothetical protein